MARVLAGVLLGAVFVAALIYATLSEAQVECEVCMDFQGASVCRTASAADRDASVRGAVMTACAVLSGGVTQGLACDRTPPRSVRCEE